MGRQRGELKAEREAEPILSEGSGGLASRESCQREMGRGERGQGGEGSGEGWPGRFEQGERRASEQLAWSDTCRRENHGQGY